MKKFLKNYYYLFIIPICIIIGYVRMKHIYNYEGPHPTMTGAVVFLFEIGLGIYLTIIAVAFKPFEKGKFQMNIVVIIEFLVLFYLLFFFLE